MAAPCRRIPCKISELQLDKTLASGQCFRWKEISAGTWRGVVLDSVWTIWQSNTELFYKVVTKEQKDSVKHEIGNYLPQQNRESISTICKHKTHRKRGIRKTQQPSSNHGMTENAGTDIRTIENDHESETKKIKIENIGQNDVKNYSELYRERLEEQIKDYFRLDINLTDLYQKWSAVDKNFKKTAEHFEGIRMLRQDPVENLFSFICSSNNNISRIGTMVEKLCQNYGEAICVLDGQTYFSFPSISSLAKDGVEDKLRELGFGYRAKYIYKSAKFIHENHSESWLYGLRNKSYKDAKTELIKLCGVGGKVADCVCLMSMDKLEAVPVDTHVWQIAARDYLPRLRQVKSLTDKLYDEIGDHFRELWGDKAGWAHSILFTADLKQFKGRTDKEKKVTERE